MSVTLAKQASRSGQLWSASVTVTALDDASRPRESVLVDAAWSSTSASFTPSTIQCTTNLNGTCTMTIRSLDRTDVPDVTLTVTGVAGPGVTAGALPAPIVVAAP